MKKVIVVALVFVAAGVAWFSLNSKPGTQTNVAATATPSAQASPVAGAVPSPVASGSEELMNRIASQKNIAGNSSAETGEELEADMEEGLDTRPAVEVYKTAEEALDAVKRGAKEYDDVVLEQFTTPGDDCTWCKDFYGMVKNTLTSADTPQEQKSYFAEILAISGKADNVQNLVDSVKNAKSPDEADLFAEALELTVGKDDVTSLLGESMNSQNETLKEASIAAITNQGSRLAAELLVKNVIDRGDPDGYYSSGIGPGEVIPNPEAIPVYQELMQRHDQFSHLGVKALLNSGLGGLKMVFSELDSVNDAQAFKTMTKDFLDHVNYEEGLNEYVQDIAKNTKNPNLAQLAKQVNDEFANEGGEGTEGTTEE